MRYIIININTNEPVKQGNDIIFFKTQTTAKKYYDRLKDKENHQIKESPDMVSKKQLTHIENEIKDIYHAIENAKSDEELLRLANILQGVLKNRRKIKNKLKGAKGNIQFATPYKNRTLILD